LRTILSAGVLAVLLLACAGTAAGAAAEADICVNESGWWRAGGAFNASGAPIQAAVDAASAVDTIEVRSGTYYENVNVDKSLTLIGEDKDTTIINGDGSGDVVKVTADGCTISGFTIQSHKHSTVDVVEIRGEVATGSFTWTPMNFAGFYYDIDADTGNETLTIITSDRTVEEGNLSYQTTPQLIDFEHGNWGGYQVIGFMTEKYFAGYGSDTDDEITSDTISLISKDVLSKILIDEDKKHMISTGASLMLQEGYELKIIQLDVDGGQAQLELLYNGDHVDTKIVRAPDTFVYKKDIGKVDDVPIIAIHISNVFAGTETDMAIIDGVFQILDDYVSIEPGTEFGVMEVKSVSPSAVILKNEDSVYLDEDCTEHIMDDIYLVTADNDSLRFYPMVEYTEPGVFEVSGEVQYVTGANPEIVWTAHNFSGFYYDLDEDTSTETLTVAANSINCSAGDRIIEENRLTYRTVSVAKWYELYESEGCTVDSSNPGGDAFYRIEGWIGEPYVAINNRADKICKLLIEFENNDKKTMATGEAWDLGRGFALTAKRIDLEGDSVWLSLSKNGRELDNQTLNTGTGNEQDRVYTYTADIGGEEAIPVFSCYVDAVFRGTDTNIVQVKYVFLIDDYVLEIKTDERYGAMEVITANSSEIILKNNETTIDLGAGTTVPIVNRLSFKVADDGATIRFYPFVEVMIGSLSITEIAGIGLISSDNNSLIGNEIRLCGCGIRLRNSNNDTLTDNIAYNNYNGILLWSSSNNMLTNNTANSNNDDGIYLKYSSNNNLTGNIASNNYFGIYLYHSNNNNLTGNIASNNTYGILLWSSSNNTLTDNNASNNHCGTFLLYSSNNNILMNSIVSDNRDGIYLRSSSSNSITCNLVQNNTDRGFYLCSGSANNRVSHNNIIENGNYNTSIGGWEWQFHNDQPEAVEAKHNYWGAGMNNSTIDASIYDDEEGQGEVTFYPFDTEPTPCAPTPDELPAFTTSDAVIALEIAAGSRPFDSRWDVSGDGQVTSLDALMILQAVAGRIEL